MKLDLTLLRLRIRIELLGAKDKISLKRRRDAVRIPSLRRKILRGALEELKMRGPENSV